MNKEKRSAKISEITSSIDESLKITGIGESTICPGVMDNDTCIDRFARDVYLCEGCRVVEHLRDRYDIYISDDFRITKLE